MSASVAYLSGRCFPKERDATKNAGTLGVATQNRGVIYRADRVSVVSKVPEGATWIWEIKLDGTYT
jgi:hypothetical protein